MKNGNQKLIHISKNRNLFIIIAAIVISGLTFFSFLIADNVMQYSFKSNASSILIGDNTGVVDTTNDTNRVSFSFTLDNVNESTIEDVRNQLDVKIIYEDANSEQQVAFIESINIIPIIDGQDNSVADNSEKTDSTDNTDTSQNTVEQNNSNVEDTISENEDNSATTDTTTYNYTDSTTSVNCEGINDEITLPNNTATFQNKLAQSILIYFAASTTVDNQQYNYNVTVTFAVPNYVDNAHYQINYSNELNENGNIIFSASGDENDITPPIVDNIKLYLQRTSEEITNQSNVTLIQGDIIILEFSITDDKSGVLGAPKVNLICSNGENIALSNPNISESNYKYEFQFNRDRNISITDLIISEIKDKAGNMEKNVCQSVSIFCNAQPVFNTGSVSSSVNLVRDGSRVTYQFSIHEEDDVNVTSLKINDKQVYNGLNSDVSVLTKSENGNFSFTYEIPTNEYSDNEEIKITEIVCNDRIGDIETYNEVTFDVSNENWNVRYYAPIPKDFINVSVSSDGGKEVGENVTICNGGVLQFSFDKKDDFHPTDFKVNSISYKVDDISQTVEIPDNIDLNEFPVKISCILPDNAEYTDLGNIEYKVSYTITDKAGGEYAFDNDEYMPSNVIYYAPIELDDIDVDLIKDINKSANNSSYAKNDDVLVLTYEIQNGMHDLTVSEFIVTNLVCTGNNGTSVQIIKSEENRDDFIIKYKVVFTDVAGQSCATREITSNLIYLAPIEVDSVNFVSNNEAFNKYAKLGSNLTFTAKANHNVEISNVILSDGIHDFKVSSINCSTQNLKFLFNGINGFTSGGSLTPIFTLTDASGNTWNSTENQIVPIKYDSENPKVSVTPKFDGFFNENFSCTAVFSDANLYVDGMSFIYADEDADTTHSALNTNGFTEGETSFDQNLTLANEGTFKISASVKDKAGNTSSSGGMVVTIDKTSPEITSVKISADSIQVFKKGFVISDYIDINEEYVNEIICKVSDVSGTTDWDIDTPIEIEGKKTISILVTDMAGNTCSYVFEIYIDDTSPVPIVKDMISDVELTSDSKNVIVKECKLYVSLEEQQINNAASDEITSLKLLDENGNLMYDFIGEEGLRTYYEYEMTEYGQYSLVLEAKDNAISENGTDGNTIGPVTYKFKFTKGMIWDIILENPVLYYVLISILLIAVIAGIVLFMMLFKKKYAKSIK